VLRTISTRLEQAGWQPLKEDWLNPGLPTSHVRGWVYFEDSTTQPSTSVRGWNGDWKNSAHDILTYMLEYRCPGNLCSSTRDLRDLRVIAIHIPADLAEQIRARFLPARRADETSLLCPRDRYPNHGILGGILPLTGLEVRL
jgi:hypothetical protein